MEYADIIRENRSAHSNISWWPMFAFHDTDVTNAVRILSVHKLYSRIDAEILGLMQNDNASRQVIDMTRTETFSNVRFYFRPLTPTQYHNEGFKLSSLRYDRDPNANIPVPVFFLFDLEKLLQMPGVQFSEKGQAGNGSKRCDSVDEFAQFNFDLIYSNQFPENPQDLKYRRAEILYPNSFAIDSCLYKIICRNDVERLTLLNLLREQDPKAYYLYKDRIICRSELFYNNGLFVTSCQYHDSILTLSFSDNLEKLKHSKSQSSKNEVKQLEAVPAKAEIVWKNAKREFNRVFVPFMIDYIHPKSVTFRLPPVPKANKLQIRVYFENALMCCIEHSLEEAELM